MVSWTSHLRHFYCIMFEELAFNSSANAAPEFQGRNGESLSNQIINEMSNLFSRNNFNLKQLCIVEGRYCWHINVDLVVTTS